MNGDNDQIRRMRALLRDFKPLLDRLKDQRRQTASRFNVTEAFGVTRDELVHSQFIAYLLNPTERHDQGDVFLSLFLQCLGLVFSPASTRGASVRTEFPLGDYGRVDIHIRLANGQIILLENKVDELEGPCQLGRYQKWLKRQSAPPEFLHYLVFLTPDSRRPVSTCTPEEVTCLSYSKLADWLSSSLQEIEAQRLRIILEHYAGTCRQIGGSTRRNAMPDEMRQFFLDPERLETALEMEKYLPVFKRWLNETFWLGVEGRLTAWLENYGHNLSWQFRFDDNLYGEFNFRNWRGWQMAWQNRQNQPHFAVRVEFWPGRGLFFGITRGAEIAEEDRDQRDNEIREGLLRNGFTEETKWWPGFRFFYDLGLPRFDLSRADDVLELCREMQNDDRPLTHRVAEVIWELFCDFRQELEDPNQNYPY